MSEQGSTPSQAPTSAEHEPVGAPAQAEAQAPTDAERELVDTPAASPAAPPRVVVPRWVQLVLLPLSLLALWALARAAGKVLLIFVVAAVIALILNPLVAFLQRRTQLPRGLAVLAVYLAFFLTLAGVGFLLANPIAGQVRTFTHNLPHIVNEANSQIASLQAYLNKHGVHAKLVSQGKTALQTLQDQVSKSAGKLTSVLGALLSEVAKALVDLVLVFVLSVYMLVYGQSIGKLTRQAMPPGDGTPADDYPTLAQHAVSRYVGGQLLFSVIMGASAGIALYVFGVLGIFPDGRKYALAFAVFYGVMELVPYIGPILGALPPVALALFSDPISALWVALLFLALQQLEGHVVAPQIFSHTLRINPLLVIFALLLGLQLYGVIGALVALPILSVLRETAIYLHRHLAFEPWERSGGLM
ncbi:MAG TPA: AI-2E family transporter [Solirubrobacteraceae bacterium]|nr:AI-2E family transporter [Solirubrobacteraceae bacterium]